MKTHETTIHITQDTFERVNRLLRLQSLDTMPDSELRALGANTRHCEGIFSAQFDDGSSIDFELCSGSSNYWDNVTWTSSDGRYEVSFDCKFELGDIEAEVDGELYTVKLAVDSIPVPEVRKTDANMALWDLLSKHLGHSVSIAAYGDPADPADVCLECEDCGEVILDAELYTICARSEARPDVGLSSNEGMPLSEIISSLRDQMQDRESMIDKDDPDCIFRHDAAMLRAAVELLERFKTQNS